MREVTLYTTKKQRVLSGDYVEVAHYRNHYQDDCRISMVGDDPLLIGDLPEDTFKVVRLPVHTLCENVDGDVVCEYIAIDQTVARLIEAKENDISIQKNRARYWKNFSNNQLMELRQLKNMSFLQKLKFAFTKTKEESNE